MLKKRTVTKSTMTCLITKGVSEMGNLADLPLYCFQAFFKCHHVTCQLDDQKISFKLHRSWEQSETSPGLNRIVPFSVLKIEFLAKAKGKCFEDGFQNSSLFPLIKI